MTSDKGFGDFDTKRFEIKEIEITNEQKADIESNKFDTFVKRNKLEFEKKLSTINEEKLKTKNEKIIELQERAKNKLNEDEQKQFNEDILSLINN